MAKSTQSDQSGPSPLYPVMEKFVKDEADKLDRDHLTPWAFFKTGTTLTVTDFHKRPIAIGGKYLEFSGSIRDVFWQFGDPFLEDIAIRSIDEVVRRGKGQCDLRQPILETQGMLISYTRKTYSRMANIDRALRGNGNPKSVPLRDTSRETKEMEARIEALVHGQLRLIPPPPSRWVRGNQWFKDHPLAGWIVATIIALAGIVGKALGIL
jgi:hypothetical protein